MAENADMLIDGFLDTETGEFIDGHAPGYPRTISKSLPWEKPSKAWQFVSFRNKKESKELYGIKAFIYRGFSKYLDKKQENNMFHPILLRYFNEVLGQDGDTSDQKIAELIQRDWNTFKQWLLLTYKK